MSVRGVCSDCISTHVALDWAIRAKFDVLKVVFLAR